jgi:hypothetical protein
LLVSKGYCCKPRWSIGRKALEPPPSDLAFDLWLGPAQSQTEIRVPTDSSDSIEPGTEAWNDLVPIWIAKRYTSGF